MLSLLLDENLSPEVARQIAEKRPEIGTVSLYHWHGGQFQAKRDEVILFTAAAERLTLVTYDQTMRRLSSRFWCNGDKQQQIMLASFLSMTARLHPAISGDWCEPLSTCGTRAKPTIGQTVWSS